MEGDAAMRIDRAVSSVCTTLVLILGVGQALAEPVCADYSAYSHEGPIGDKLEINGFITTDTDNNRPSEISKSGLSLSNEGVLIKLPTPANEVRITALSQCATLEIRAMSERSAIAVLYLQNDPEKEYLLSGGHEVTRIMTYGGCHEGKVISICIDQP
jgi:hypothetical protein